MSQKKPKVAVIGASGIGKHHAKWHHQSGSEVVAFLGSNADRCAQTQKTLSELFGFSGCGYWQLDRLLQETAPDIVDVCSPSHLHGRHVAAALEAGCHVLCEKPFVWDEGTATDGLLKQADALIETAAGKGLKLGVCTQYAAGIGHYERMYTDACGPVQEITEFYAEMETLSRGRTRDAAALWTDMGSHPLSLLLAWMPEGRIEAGSLRAEFGPNEASVEFVFAAQGQACTCRVIVRDIDGGVPLRRFGVNGYVVDCAGKNDAQGVYRIALQAGRQEVLWDDYMSLLIGQFTQAVRQDAKPLVDGRTGRHNLALQLQILAAAG